MNDYRTVFRQEQTKTVMNYVYLANQTANCTFSVLDFASEVKMKKKMTTGSNLCPVLNVFS